MKIFHLIRYMLSGSYRQSYDKGIQAVDLMLATNSITMGGKTCRRGQK